MRRVALSVLLCAGVARADTGELSLRLFGELRHGTMDGPGDSRENALARGGGLLVGYGLSFHWTATARYVFENTGELSGGWDARPAREVWRRARHAGLLGVSFALSDEWTPVLMAEAGLARVTLADRRTLTADDLELDRWPAEDRLVPVARATACYEWRFLDFWSAAPGAVLELESAELTYGVQLWLAWYVYL